VPRTPPLELIDLHDLGKSEAIASCLMETPAGPLLIDPSRLLESARRIYRSEMERLWGGALAVPAGDVRALAGGETLGFGTARLVVAHTPGHAPHHVSFFDPASGAAFVGDTGGNRYSSGPYVSPVTPPPDVDLAGWRRSIERIRAWRPARLVSTHFGISEPVDAHLDELARRLEEWSERVRASLVDPSRDDPARAAEFAEWVAAQVREHLDEADARIYEWGTTALNSWHGLARYWRSRGLDESAGRPYPEDAVPGPPAVPPPSPR
jgi:glyoxylase-like metal-dependent hydrolase (beta-lactamase superfamily II)